jgi:hypothetical protein
MIPSVYSFLTIIDNLLVKSAILVFFTAKFRENTNCDGGQRGTIPTV